MKITLIGPVFPYRGGIAQTTAIIAENLAAPGREVDVISFSRQYPAWLYPGTSDREPGVKKLPFPVRYLLDPVYPWTWEKAVRQVKAAPPDLVIIVWWTTFWAPAYTYLAWRLKKQGFKIAFLIHNLIPHEKRAFDPLLARLALSQAHRLITLSKRQQQAASAMFPGAEVFQGVLPFYPDSMGSSLSRSEARLRLNLPPDKTIALFFGLVRPYKGLKYLLEALSRVKDLDVLLVVAGEFWGDAGEYLEQIDRSGIRGQVILHNRYIPGAEVPCFFRAADYFVAPYTAGTQSAASKLAMSFGLPILWTDRIAEEDSSLVQTTVVPAEDAAALAEAMRYLTLNPPARQDPRVLGAQTWKMLEEALLGQAGQP